jgi:hypothetical protein
VKVTDEIAQQKAPVEKWLIYATGFGHFSSPSNRLPDGFIDIWSSLVSHIGVVEKVEERTRKFGLFNAISEIPHSSIAVSTILF